MSRPFFTAYPRLEANIPLVALAELPTPLEPLSALAPNLWIKRDDQTGAVYGGNKVRKLEFILGYLKQIGQKRVLTFGAIGTNHGVATALYCQQHGIDCSVLLFDQPVTDTVQKNLRLMQRFGAHLTYCGSLWQTVLRFFLVERLKRRDTYFLFAGGSTIEGCIGYVSAAFELKQQIDQGEMPVPDVIYCPVGSSSTVAGLTLGCVLAGLPTKVVGVRVAPSHLGLIPTCTPRTIRQLMKQTYCYLRRLDNSIPVMPLPDINLDESYYGEGYGMATAEGEAALTSFKKAGIVLEQTYTAKTAAATIEHSKRHTGEVVLYWHTYNSVDMSSVAEEANVAALSQVLQGILQG